MDYQTFVRPRTIGTGVNAISATDVAPKNIQIMKMDCSMLTLLRLLATFDSFFYLVLSVIASADGSNDAMGQVR